jgi:L-ribulose-5-phosphate 3-epimerase
MSFSRRSFLATAGAAIAGGPFALRAGKAARLRIGITDWNLNQTSKLEAVALAKKLGFDGVQISLGIKPVDGKLRLDNGALQARYLAAAANHQIPIDGTCLDILHVNYLKNDRLGQKWVADSIRITQSMKTRVILLPFFGKGALETRQEMDYVGDVLKELGPEAEKAGVILGIEDTISAEDNARIVDRAQSKAVLVYYDVGNSTIAGFDPVKEIKWLGKSRICQFHLKDNPHYLGEGKIDFAAVMQAIADIGYTGYANLETDSPSKSVEADLTRNLQFVRKLMT